MSLSHHHIGVFVGWFPPSSPEKQYNTLYQYQMQCFYQNTFHLCCPAKEEPLCRLLMLQPYNMYISERILDHVLTCLLS